MAKKYVHSVPETTSATEASAAAGSTARVPSKLQVSGRVSLTAGRGQQVDPGELADTLVYFVPTSGGAPAKPGQFTVYTHNRDFSPEALAVPLGSTVTFVNLDDVRHNVFSVTPGSSFDLGYQASGEKAAHVFNHAGIVLVSCNVHHSMELDVLVVPTAYSVKVAADGSFSLRNLPAGPGTLHFWNPRSMPMAQAVTLPFDGSIKQVLQVTKPAMSMNSGAGSKS